MDRESGLGKAVLAGRRRGQWQMVLGLLGLLMASCQIWGLQVRSEPKRYDPDPQACQVEMIRTTYRSNLLPWQDQPEVVQQRLRQLQAAMTLDTLRECQAKGLLTPAQVTSLTTELKLPGAVSEPAQSPVRP